MVLSGRHGEDGFQGAKAEIEIHLSEEIMTVCIEAATVVGRSR